MKAYLLAIVAGVLVLSTESELVGQNTPEPTDGHATRLSVTQSVNIPGGGWEWGEAVRAIGLGAEIQIVGATSIWFSASRAEINNLTGCTERCYYGGTPFLLQTGLGYRFASDQRGRLVPFAGVGVSVEQWSEGGRRWMPHVQAGVEWLAIPHVALRLEVESEWSVPGRILSGVTVIL